MDNNNNNEMSAIDQEFELIEVTEVDALSPSFVLLKERMSGSHSRRKSTKATKKKTDEKRIINKRRPSVKFAQPKSSGTTIEEEVKEAEANTMGGEGIETATAVVGPKRPQKRTKMERLLK